MRLLETLRAFFVSAPRRKPEQCFPALRNRQAVLVDVREAREWRSGVAEGALLLPLTDLTGSRELWGGLIASAGTREVLVYCQAGGRSGLAARILRLNGVNAVDVGALRDWRNAGWRIAKPDDPR